MTKVLEGVERENPPAGADLTREEVSALARQGRVAYRVSAAPPRGPVHGDKRASQRRRSRLHSAKLLDSNNRFLCECLVHDRSSAGLRLTLMKNVGLPSRCSLFDDETGEVRMVALVWRRGPIVGMHYRANERLAPLSQSARAALRGRYYAMTD